MFFIAFLVICACNCLPFRDWEAVNASKYEQVALCVAAIAKRYSGPFPVVFIAEQTHLPSAQAALAKMEGLVIVDSSVNVSRHRGLFAIFFHRENFGKIVGNMKGKEGSKFLVAVDYQKRPRSKKDVADVFAQFWNLNIMDVVVVVPFSKHIRIYTSQPYSAWRCGDAGSPVLINRWIFGNKSFAKDVDLYSNREKVFNLHGCTLKCAVVNRPPDCNVVKSQEVWNAFGSGYKIFDVVRRKMNFTAEIVPFGINKNDTDKSPFGSAHLAFGKFVRALDSHLDPSGMAQFLNENQVDCYTWGVPRGKGLQPSIWDNYIVEFSPKTWAMIGCSLVVAAFVIKRIAHRSRLRKFNDTQFVIFFAFSTMIGAHFNMKERSAPLLVFLTQWLFYSFVIMSCYQAYMGSLMTIPHRDAEIERQCYLLNTTLNLVGSEEVYRILNESSMDEEYQDLAQRFLLPPPVQFESLIRRVHARRDVAVLAARRELIYYAEKRPRGYPPFVHVLDKCIFRFYRATFMLPGDSPFSAPISEVLSRLFETGHYDFWDRDNIRAEMAHNVIFTSDTVLMLKELYGAFAVLFIGWGLACVVFTIEWLININKEKERFLVNYHGFPFLN